MDLASLKQQKMHAEMTYQHITAIEELLKQNAQLQEEIDKLKIELDAIRACAEPKAE